MNPTAFWILGGAAALLFLLTVGRKKAAAQPGIEPYLDPTKITRPVDERFFYDRDEIYRKTEGTRLDPIPMLAELRFWYMNYLRKKGQKGFVVDNWIREYERIRREEPAKHANAVAMRHQRYLAEKQAVA